MARRPGEDGGFRLSARNRQLVGWVAAAGVLVGIAVVLGLLGGNGDGAPVAPAGTTTPSTGAAEPIAFGTALDPATGQVADDAAATQFVTDDTFAYSIGPRDPMPGSVYVEVERVGGGSPGVVQPAAEQALPAGARAVAFAVPAGRLFDDFGPGRYRMRIFTDPAGPPLAEGGFDLLAPAPSGSTAASAIP